MKFINIFLDRPRILFLTLAFIVLAGISSAFSVPIQENPELAKRWGHINIFYPGATQERVETQVVTDLEIKLREVVEIRELRSNITQGYGRLGIELEQSVTPDLIDQTWSKIQNKMDQIIAPDGTQINLDISSGPPITVQYAFLWNGEGKAPEILISRLAQQLKRKLSSIGATENTAIYGEAEEEILIEIDSAKMTSLDLTYQDISRAISSFDNKKPVGVVSDNYSQFLIKLKDNIKSPQKIGEIPIKVINQSEIIRLQDIATISIEPAFPYEDLYLFNGQRVVSVSTTGSMSQRVFDYVDRAESVVDEIRETLPDEISIELIYDESVYVGKKFDTLVGSLH